MALLVVRARGFVGAYGTARAAAETAVRAVDPGAVLVRTSLTVGEGSKQAPLCRDALRCCAVDGW